MTGAVTRCRDHGPGSAHRDGQRFLRQQVQAGVERGQADLMVQEHRAGVQHGIDDPVGDHPLPVGVDARLHVRLKVAEVGVRRGQGIAGLGGQHRRPRRWALAAGVEHPGIRFLAGRQGGDAEVVDALVAQPLKPLQVGVQDAPQPTMPMRIMAETPGPGSSRLEEAPQRQRHLTPALDG